MVTLSYIRPLWVTGNVLLDLTLVIHNVIISYDAANYHNILN